MLKSRVLVALTLAIAAGWAQAQSWPTKPVRWFVAAAPGSAPDIVARLVAERVQEGWGQQIVIENRAGAAGNIGTAAAARAPADGYNWLFGQAAPLVSNAFTFKSLPFNTEKDFVPVVSLGISPMMIAVNPSTGIQSIADLIAAAKAQPGRLAFATSGSKNIPHMTGELINATAGVKMLNVPYGASTQASTDTLSGRTQVYIDGIPPMAGHMKSGRLRVIAVSSPQRLPNFPDIPSVAETLPGFTMVGWFAIMAPTGTSRELVARVNRDVNEAVKVPAVAQRLLQLGIYEPGGTPEDLARFMQAERLRWEKAVRASGIEPE